MNKLKKLLLTLFIFCIFTIFKNNSTTLFAYTDVNNFAPKYGITTENVNFRQGLSKKAKVIKTISKNTIIKMVAEYSDFYVVQLSSNEVGSISKKYVKTSLSAPKGAKTYSKLNIKLAVTKEKSVNLRGGPGTNFRSILSLSQNSEIKVIGYIDDFYMVINKDYTIGMIRKDLLKFIVVNNNTKVTTPSTPSVKGDNLEELVLSYINLERTKVKIPALKFDNSLLKIARIKSSDIVTNNYFSHTSPKYGSPFKMMKDNKISYIAAGENIAGNSNLKTAVDNWMKSPGHKENILSNAYNYIGIGVTKSNVYGYVITAMFIGR